MIKKILKCFFGNKNETNKRNIMNFDHFETDELKEKTIERILKHGDFSVQINKHTGQRHFLVGSQIYKGFFYNEKDDYILTDFNILSKTMFDMYREYHANTRYMNNHNYKSEESENNLKYINKTMRMLSELNQRGGLREKRVYED